MFLDLHYKLISVEVFILFEILFSVAWIELQIIHVTKEKCSFVQFTDFWLVAVQSCVKRGSAEKDHLGAIT